MYKKRTTKPHAFIFVFYLFSQISPVFACQLKVELWQIARCSPNLCFLFFWTASLMLDGTEFQQVLVAGLCVTSGPAPLKSPTHASPCSLPSSDWMWIRIKANEMVERSLEWPHGGLLTAFWKCLNTHPGLVSEEEIHFYYFEHQMFKFVTAISLPLTLAWK